MMQQACTTGGGQTMSADMTPDDQADQNGDGVIEWEVIVNQHCCHADVLWVSEQMVVTAAVVMLFAGVCCSI